MYRFEHPEYFWWLAGLLLPAGLFLLHLTKRNRTLRSWFSNQNILLSIPGFSRYKTVSKFAATVAIIVMLGFVLANPLAGKKVNRQIQSKGSDIQFVVDISNSMLCEDIKPSRLDKAKQILLGIIDRMGSDRVGLVVFAGDAFIQLPMTIDQTAASMFVRNMSPDLISRQGTAIELALRTAITSIDSSKSKHPAIVLLSDGEDFEGYPKTVISELTERKIPVHTIAIGTEKGGPIPQYRAGIRSGYKKDNEGNTVITKPDETFLAELAKSTGGVFVSGDNLGNAAESISAEIDKMEKDDNRSMQFSDFNSLYLWFLIPAFILLIIEFFLNEKRMKWQDNLRKFIERRSV